jgi:hypothetical protein
MFWGLELICPVFTQDKFLYIQHLPEFFNATLQVKLPYTSNSEMDIKIDLFLLENNQDSGWVVKLPFTKNVQAIKFCYDINQIKKALLFYSCKINY